MRNNLIVADYGPHFVGLVGRVPEGQLPDGLVCVTTPRYEYDVGVRSVMRELVEREGGNCELCLNCPIAYMKN